MEESLPACTSENDPGNFHLQPTGVQDAQPEEADDEGVLELDAVHARFSN